MMMDKRGIKKIINEVTPDIIAMRRHIHENQSYPVKK